MSQQSFLAALRQAAGKTGSHLTRETREQHLSRFAEQCWKAGYQVNTVAQIKDKHIRGYVEARLADGASKRTVQNELANIRKALRGAGRGQYADGAEISNKALGISGASRIGTKTVMRDADLAQFKAAAAKLEPGVAACLALQRELGLRKKEALMSVASLKAWARQIAVSGAVIVLHGTKGGRTRQTPVINPETAAKAVSEAMALAKAQGGRLIPRDDLKTALARYSYVCRRVGMTGEQAGHSLRYAYAQDQLRKLLSEGVPQKEARAAVSMFLGHGDGRGRWVAMVYARGVER